MYSLLEWIGQSCVAAKVTLSNNDVALELREQVCLIIQPLTS